jgi:uncharacterized protein
MTEWESGRWHNPPAASEIRDGELHVRTGANTDFWNRTFYGFTHDNGHFFARAVTGDFTAELIFTVAYRTLYDQAGLMVWVDAETWLKAGVEFTDGVLHFSVVLTRNDQSDWSVIPLAHDPSHPVRLRLTRHAEALRIEVGTDKGWQMARLGFLPMPDQVEIGPMCCSPLSENLAVTFSRFTIAPPISRDLHA